MVITKDSESFDPGSSPGRTFCLVPGRIAVFVETESSFPVLVAQLDKASDYESEDWGFKSLQGYLLLFCLQPVEAGFARDWALAPCLDARVV